MGLFFVNTNVMMNKEYAIVFLEELKDFLTLDIGVGEIFGTLGHDAGGVLSHEVLCNDPCCTAYLLVLIRCLKERQFLGVSFYWYLLFFRLFLSVDK